MTNSEDVESAWSVVRAVLEALDEGRIRREIDERVDLAAFSFAMPHEQTGTQKEFLATVGEYVRHLYGQALAVPRNLAPDQARYRVMEEWNAQVQPHDPCSILRRDEGGLISSGFRHNRRPAARPQPSYSTGLPHRLGSAHVHEYSPGLERGDLG